MNEVIRCVIELHFPGLMAGQGAAKNHDCGVKEDMAVLKELLAECDLPVILVQKHGFTLRVEPDRCRIQDNDIVFFLQGSVVCRLCLDGVVLVSKRRPDNFIVRCKRCFALMQGGMEGVQLCEMVWPK